MLRSLWRGVKKLKLKTVQISEKIHKLLVKKKKETGQTVVSIVERALLKALKGANK
jgi:hypothetical protein